MRRVVIAVALLSLVGVPSAVAGGWATVGLDSTPAGVKAGQPWKVKVTVLQHGRTPLEGVQPAVTIRSAGATRTFDAQPTAKPGVYAASVTFPSAGRWTYTVSDGFISQQPHTFPAVRIGEPASAPAAAVTDDGGPSATWLGLGAVAFALAALILLGRRHRRHEPQAA